MTIEKLVEECKRLRLESERSEAKFFAFLMVAEREHGPVWRDAGCATFDQFLRSNDLCMPDRYRLFAAGVDKVGIDTALANGAHWTMQAGKMPTTDRATLDKFAERAAAFIELNHVTPSELQSRQWATELTGGPAGREYSGTRRVDELHQLRAENARLKAENKALLRRIEELEGRKPASSKPKEKRA